MVSPSTLSSKVFVLWADPRYCELEKVNDVERLTTKGPLELFRLQPRCPFGLLLVHRRTSPLSAAARLRGYDGFLRQIIVRGNGRERPAFLITNDFEQPAELAVGNYARRWRVENGIAEAVKFFHLNALSSPILVKVHFDVQARKSALKALGANLTVPVK